MLYGMLWLDVCDLVAHLFLETQYLHDSNYCRANALYLLIGGMFMMNGYKFQAFPYLPRSQTGFLSLLALLHVLKVKLDKQNTQSVPLWELCGFPLVGTEV